MAKTVCSWHMHLYETRKRTFQFVTFWLRKIKTMEEHFLSLSIIWAKLFNYVQELKKNEIAYCANILLPFTACKFCKCTRFLQNSSRIYYIHNKKDKTSSNKSKQRLWTTYTTTENSKNWYHRHYVRYSTVVQLILKISVTIHNFNCL